jgi:putative hydrolase of the HAD superfamily
MIQAIIFDLDNTLTDFMKMKRAAIDAAVDGMIDAGLKLSHAEISEKIYGVYDREGIEYQQVFDLFLKEELDRIDYKILTSAIVAYGVLATPISSSTPT